MNLELQKIYRPLTLPFYERIDRWTPAVSYGAAEVVGGAAVKVVRYALPASSELLCGKKLVFASDFHYSGTAPQRERAREAARLIKNLQPDYLCFGGDAVGDATTVRLLPGLLDIFAGCPGMKLAIPGNWERGKRWLNDDFWSGIYAEHGFKYLCNSGVETPEFYFYGCDDISDGAPVLPPVNPAGKFPVLLAHRPDTVVALDVHRSLRRFPLILCGHTHAGQVRLPFFGPLCASSFYGCKLAYGCYERRGKHTRMIVSSGMGELSFPWRFCCRREIVLVEFV